MKRADAIRSTPGTTGITTGETLASRQPTAPPASYLYFWRFI